MPSTDAVTEEYEMQTVVRSGGASAHTTAETAARMPYVPDQDGRSGMWINIAVALLIIFFLVVLIGRAALWFLWPRITDSTNTAKHTQSPTPAASPTAKPTASPQPSKTPLNVNGSKSGNNSNTDRTPVPTVTPVLNDPPPARITFSKGSISERVSGVVARSRSYALRTLDGQFLTSSLDSPDNCVTFTNGSSTTSFNTLRGDSYINIKNNCGHPAKFTLLVTVR